MSIRLNFGKLKQAAEQIPDISGERDARFRQYISTPGEIYLYENVIKPFLRDEIPDAARLDLSAFTEDDLESVTLYFNENLGEDSENHGAVESFYETFLAEPPMLSPVVFL